MKKFHLSAKGAVEPCRATKRACPRGGDDVHFTTREDAIRTMLKARTEVVGSSPAEARAQVRIRQARARFLKSGTPEELARREVMADRVPLCFKHHCYAPTLAERTVRVVEASDPEVAADREIQHIARYAPVSLSPFFTPSAAYEEDDTYFGKEWAAKEVVFKDLEGVAKSMALRPSLSSQVENALDRMADPEFELDAHWYHSEERSVFEKMAPHILARLEDEVDEARVYEMMHTA